MFKNYLKTAWRNITKSKMHSFINIAGLSVGMVVALLIGMWVYDEVSFNKNFANHGRIAQVIQNVTNNGEVQTLSNVPYPLAEELRKNYGADFKHVVLSSEIDGHVLTLDEKKLSKQGVYFESEAPEMFSLKMLYGNWSSLKDPSSILLSTSTAKAFFGNKDPMDEVMKIDNQLEVKVTGVYEDFPHNSTFADLGFISTWDIFFNNTEWIKTHDNPWWPNNFSIFVQVIDNADFDKVSARIKDSKLKKVKAQLAKKKPAIFLQPMDKWNLYADFKNGVNTGGAIQYVRMFTIIGVFVLLLACINFMNLSTARSEMRAKEVGIRKTIGSLRRQLIIQFFTESLITVAFSFIVSLVLLQLTLGSFNEVADKKMLIPWGDPFFWLLCIGFVIITGLIAGSYPAFYLSSFKPIKVLKGTFKAGRFAVIPRKVLVVVQFAVSVALIIGTAVVYQQIQFAKNRPVGYTRAGLVMVPMANAAIHDHFDAVKDDLMKTGAIVSMAESGSPTTGIWGSSSGFHWEGKDPGLAVEFKNINVSYDYGKTLGWQFKEGRDFSKDFPTDSAAFILNEAAADFIGFKNTVGETIEWWQKPYKVIGVIKNMIMQSPYEPPKPTIFFIAKEQGSFSILKINPAKSAKSALTAIKPIFKKYNPEQFFDYKFVDEEYAKKFGNEERVGKLSGFFAILAIAISCLGLFGLASFVAEQRKKEIGVRKVLGASVFSVWNLLSRDFVVLGIIAFVIAVPLSYYFMHNWLQNYQYRTNISWWIFAAAGIVSLLITIAAVSYHAIKAAVANPVKSLRTE